MKYLVLIIIGVTLFSCKCEDGICDGFTESLMTYAPYPASTNKVVFENDSNQTLEFNFNSTDKTYEKVQKSHRNEVGGCSYYDCDNKYYGIWFITPDTSRTNYDTSGTIIYHIKNNLSFNIVDKIYEYEGDRADATLSIFDAKIEYQVYPNVKYNPEDTLLTTFTAGSTTYNNVLVHHIDTQTVYRGRYIIKPFVQRVYYNHELGLIAFYD
ncbi:MAG: hypothetical protein GW818_07270, partial [Flavobacteriales bacterium]|nr:hypothetical protein [Flavobacteriales bacterium]